MWEFARLLGCAFGVGAQVGPRPGDGLHGRREDRGKAQQRAFHIELRRLRIQQRGLRLSRAHHCERAHQPFGRRLHLQDGDAAAGGHQVA